MIKRTIKNKFGLGLTDVRVCVCVCVCMCVCVCLCVCVFSSCRVMNRHQMMFEGSLKFDASGLL